MRVRGKDGNVYFTASKSANPSDMAGDCWDVNYIGPSILDSVGDFDRLCEPEGQYYYCCGTLDADGTVSIGQFFARSLGWIIENGKVRTCIFGSLEGDVKAAVRECEEAFVPGGRCDGTMV